MKTKTLRSLSLGVIALAGQFGVRITVEQLEKKISQGQIASEKELKNKTGLMVGAYQVSGEYAGIALAAEKNLLNLNDALLESWHVMKRAGAQFIISYGARKSKELGIRE